MVFQSLEDECQPEYSRDSSSLPLERTKVSSKGLSGTMKCIFGSSYAGIMAVLGLIIIGLEVNLVQIGTRTGASIALMSVALIVRAFGSILGSFISGKILGCFSPHTVVLGTVLLDAFLLFSVPFLNSQFGFHSVYFCFGFLIPISEAGVQLLTCQVHESNAGPWLQFNNICMWFATMLVPFMHLTLGLRTECFVIAGAAWFMVFVLMGLSCSAQRLHEGNQQGLPFSDDAAKLQSLQASELLVACILFWVYGVVVQTTAYAGTYVLESNVLPVEQTDLLLAVFLLSALFGQALAMHLQSSMDTFQLFTNLAWLLILGGVSMGLIFGFQENAVIFWFGMSLFGFCVGPVSGYCYDLWNRTCCVSEKGAAFVVCGAYLGSGLYPFVTIIVWSHFNFPGMLILSNMVGCAIPLLLMLIVWYTSSSDSKRTRSFSAI